MNEFLQLLIVGIGQVEGSKWVTLGQVTY